MFPGLERDARKETRTRNDSHTPFFDCNAAPFSGGETIVGEVEEEDPRGCGRERPKPALQSARRGETFCNDGTGRHCLAVTGFL